jgi:hypothetical protein
MIKAILVFNHRGKVRLTKFYEHYVSDKHFKVSKHKIIYE